MAEEFRFLISEETLEKQNPNTLDVSDFTDYYLSRNKRVRHFTKDKKYAGKYLLIATEPGMIKKEKKEILEKEAKDLINQAILIVKKKGAGRFFIKDIEGYSERVSALKPGEKKPFIDELHVEFETSQEEIPKLEKILKPARVIRIGLFDYINS